MNKFTLGWIGYSHTYIHNCIYTYIQIYIHIHTYIHTCIIYFYEFNTGNASGPLKVLYTVKKPGVDRIYCFL